MSLSPTPLSVLDLVPVAPASGPREAIAGALEAAQAADRLGYARYWFAEHHSIPQLASAAPSLLICRAASLTQRIRVGAGGIMLPNHAPLSVAEHVGTLAQLFGDRIDLGIGRAPGTDAITASLLRRHDEAPSSLLDQVTQIHAWMQSAGRLPLGVTVPVAAGTDVPMWMLGSSPVGASLAASLGLPFAVAGHFAPGAVDEAITRYREEFDGTAATAQTIVPRVMVSASVCVAPTDAEAARRSSPDHQYFIDTVLGQHARLETVPTTFGDVQEAATSAQIIGSGRVVAEKLQEIVERTGADELIVTCCSPVGAERIEALELLAEAWGLDA